MWARMRVKNLTSRLERLEKQMGADWERDFIIIKGTNVLDSVTSYEVAAGRFLAASEYMVSASNRSYSSVIPTQPVS